MEPGIVSLASAPTHRRTVAKIETALKSFETSVETGQDGVEADAAFHEAIAEAAGNPLFKSLMEFARTALRESLHISHRSMAKVKGSLARVQREHKTIYRAIRDRDEAAAHRAAVIHLTRAASRMSITFT